MTLTFSQRPVDLYVLTLYVGWQAPSRQRFRLFSYTLPVLVALGVGSWLVGNGILDFKILALVGLLGTGAVFLMPRLVRWLQIRRMDQMIAKHPNPKLLVGPRTLFFEPQNLRLQVEDQQTSYAWSEMQEWVELNNHYVLFVKPQVGLILPKEAFESAEEKEKILGFIRERVGKETAFV